ncbi:MAG: hypothetical protein WA066_04550, partial [Candidatus Omnitrophota bacterium]
IEENVKSKDLTPSMQKPSKSWLFKARVIIQGIVCLFLVSLLLSHILFPRLAIRDWIYDKVGIYWMVSKDYQQEKQSRSIEQQIRAVLEQKGIKIILVESLEEWKNKYGYDEDVDAFSSGPKGEIYILKSRYSLETLAYEAVNVRQNEINYFQILIYRREIAKGKIRIFTQKYYDLLLDAVRHDQATFKMIEGAHNEIYRHYEEEYRKQENGKFIADVFAKGEVFSYLYSKYVTLDSGNKTEEAWFNVPAGVIIVRRLDKIPEAKRILATYYYDMLDLPLPEALKKMSHSYPASPATSLGRRFDSRASSPIGLRWIKNNLIRFGTVIVGISLLLIHPTLADSINRYYRPDPIRTSQKLEVTSLNEARAAIREQTQGKLFYPDGTVMLGEHEPGIAYNPRTDNYKYLLDKEDGGYGDAKKIANAGFKVIRVYLSSLEKMKELELISKRIYDQYNLKTKVIFSPYYLNVIDKQNDTALYDVIDEFVEHLAVHPWILIQVGNEDHYYLAGGIYAENGKGIPLIKREYYEYYDKVARLLKAKIEKKISRKGWHKPILLGQGIHLNSERWKEELEENIKFIKEMKNIDGLVINAYLNPPQFYKVLTKYLSERL